LLLLYFAIKSPAWRHMGCDDTAGTGPLLPTELWCPYYTYTGPLDVRTKAQPQWAQPEEAGPRKDWLLGCWLLDRVLPPSQILDPRAWRSSCDCSVLPSAGRIQSSRDGNRGQRGCPSPSTSGWLPRTARQSHSSCTRAGTREQLV
jgi:hypothetical protein